MLTGEFKMYFLKKFLLCIIGGSLCLSSIVVLAKKPHHTDTEAKYLFVESAQGAEIQKDNNGNYKLILKKADPWTIYFSDRPKQDMGFMPVEDFLVKMEKEGKNFAPKGLNAALVSLDKKKKIVSYIFTLSHPQYIAKNESIIFNAQVVTGKTITIVPPEVELKHVALFIDACVGCVGPP